MVKNRKAKGTKMEYDVIEVLNNNEYPVVVRSAGSLGPVDLVAIHKTGFSYIISVKYLRKYSRKSEESEIKTLASRAIDCCAILAYRDKPRGKIIFENLYNGNYWYFKKNGHIIPLGNRNFHRTKVRLESF